MPRPRDDYDDDDFDGYNRPQRRESGGRSRVAVILIGVGIVLAMLVGVLVLFMSRSQRAEHAAERARADVLRVEDMRAAGMRDNVVGPKTREASGPAWPRMLGMWARTPGEKEDGGYPYQIAFRRDSTATTLRVNYEGEPIQQESKVEVLSDQNDVARLRLQVHMGMYNYTFTLKPDGTLSLDDGKGGLVFGRVK